MNTCKNCGQGIVYWSWTYLEGAWIHTSDRNVKCTGSWTFATPGDVIV